MKYDLIIIGAGPAGYTAGIQAGKQGWKVLVVDRKDPGGTCLHTGCIPATVFYQIAFFLSKAMDFSKKGIFSNPPLLHFPNLLKHKNNIIERLQKGIEYLFKSHHVEFMKGEAGIVDENHVLVRQEKKETVLEAREILIASGSREHIPESLRDVPCFTGESVWSMEYLPESMAVVGGGVVGTEIAAIFSQLGVAVSLIEITDNILSFLDDDLRSPVLSRLRENNVRVFQGTEVTRARHEDKKIKLTFQGKDGILVDRLVLSAGREPDTSLFHDTIKPEMHNGFLVVDENYRTSLRNIRAIGDVINQGKMFAHLAAYQAVDCIKKIHGKTFDRPQVFMPYGLFTLPQVAGIGWMEKDLPPLGIRFNVKKVSSLSTSSGKLLDLKHGFLKLILSRDKGEILGGHVVSENAVELISILSLLFNNPVPKDLSSLHRTLFLHPSESELFAEHVLEENEKRI